MATSYTGLRVQDTYNAIIKIGDNSNLTGVAKLLSDGLGNDSPLYLSTSRLGIGITPAYQFHTSGNAKIGGNLIISGNLTVNGTLTYLNVTDLQVEDPLIKLAKDNTSNTLDIGFFGKYVESATTKYTGLFWDASTDKFRLYEGLQVEPTTTVDVTGTGYTRSLLNADLEGNVTGTVSSLSNHDTNDLVEGSFNQYFTTARARASFSAGDGITITNGVIASEGGSADTAKRIEITVKNVSGSTLVKGAAVHASPTATPPSGNVIEVIGADNDVTASMPAIGILNEAIADEAEGQCVMVGSVTGINTSSFTAGEELYVGSTAGVLTNTKPTSTSNQIQKIAVVIKSHASNGQIEVFGAGRANDVPNLVNRTITFDPSINVTSSTGLASIEVGGASGGFIDLKAPASDDYDLRFITSQGGNEITTASGDLKINTANTLALTIDSSQDANFVGTITANAFRTKSASTDYSLITRDSDVNFSLYVQSVEDSESANIARFLYGSATANNGTVVLEVGAGTSYFDNANLGVRTDTPISALQVKGNGDAPSFFTHSYGVSAGFTVAGDESLIEIISTDSGSHGGSFNIRGGNKGYSFINNPDSFRFELKYFEADANNFHTHSSGGNVSTLNDLLFIDKVGLATFWGKLGVGVAPTTKLHIKGDGDRIQISSADYDLVKIGAFGDTGADIDNGFLNLLLDGVEKIRLLASGNSYFNGGNVGFGEVDAAGYWGQANDIVIDTSGNGGITIKSTSAGNGRLVFTDTKSSTAGNTDGGMITYNHSDDEMRFQTNGSQKIVIDSSGNLGVNVTDPDYKLEIGGSGSEINLKGGNNRIRFSGHRALEGATDASLLQIGEGYGTARMYGRVGFGISPGTGNTVHIYKNATIGAIGATTVANGGLRIEDSGANMYFDGNSIVLDNTGYLTTNISADFVLGTNNTARIHIDAGGYIGIANTDPSNKLHIYHNDSMGNPSSFDATKAGLRIQDSANDLYLDGNGVVTTGTSDLFIGATSNQGIRFYANATNVMQIQADGNIGINESSPFAKLHIKESDTGVTTPSAQGNLLVLEDSENGLSILSSTAGAGYINFGDSDDNDIGMIIYGHSSNSMDFWTNAGKRMTIDSSGALTVTTAASTIATFKATGFGQNEKQLIIQTGGDRVILDAQTTTGATTDFAFETGGTERILIKSDGNIGINESNPSRLLTIKGGASGETGTINDHTQIFIENDDDAYIETRVPTSKLTGLRFTDNTVSAGGVIYAHNTSSFPNYLGLGAWAAISFRVGGTSGVFEKTEVLHIDSDVVKIVNATSPKLQLNRGSKTYTTRVDNADKFVIQEEGGGEFFVVEAGASSNSIRIDSSGNVGINNSNPATKLDVIGTGSFLGAAASGAPLVTIENNSGSTATSYGLLVKGGGNSASGKTFEVRDDSGNTDLIVKGNGSLGIGTADPSEKLEVSGGNIRIENTSTQICSLSFSEDNTNKNIIMEYDGTGSGAGNYFSFYSNVSGWMSKGSSLNIQPSTGRVGIGEINPDEQLHLKVATGDPRIKLETGGGGDPGIIFQSANNRTGEMFFQDGSTSARFSYDHAGVAFKMYAHNQSSIDFYLSETMAYFPQQNVGIGTNTVVKDFQVNFNSASTSLASTLGGAPAGPGALIQNTNSTVNNFANLDFRSNNADARIACQYISSNTAWFRFIQDNSGTLQNTATLKSNGDFSAIGSITASGDVIAFSDKRIKTNIKTIDNSLEKISKLRGVSYNRTDIDDKSNKIGVIAQEVKEVLPEVVNYDDENDLLGVDYGKMAGVFIEAIKELKAEVDSLKQEIKQLKK